MKGIVYEELPDFRFRLYAGAAIAGFVGGLVLGAVPVLLINGYLMYLWTEDVRREHQRKMLMNVHYAGLGTSQQYRFYAEMTGQLFGLGLVLAVLQQVGIVPVLKTLISIPVWCSWFLVIAYGTAFLAAALSSYVTRKG